MYILQNHKKRCTAHIAFIVLTEQVIFLVLETHVQCRIPSTYIEQDHNMAAERRDGIT